MVMGKLEDGKLIYVSDLLFNHPFLCINREFEVEDLDGNRIKAKFTKIETMKLTGEIWLERI